MRLKRTSTQEKATRGNANFAFRTLVASKVAPLNQNTTLHRCNQKQAPLSHAGEDSGLNIHLPDIMTRAEWGVPG